VAVSTACGHTAYGRFSRLLLKQKRESWANGAPDSKDIRYNTWWEDHGVHPNHVIQLHVDPIGGSEAWFTTVVKVSPAQSGDKYGDVSASVEASIKDFENTMRYSVAGDMHEKMHPEMKGKVDFEELRRKVGGPYSHKEA